MNINLRHLAIATLLSTSMLAPTIAMAGPETKKSKAEQRRNQKKNEWKNLTFASGALGVLGILTKNGTMTTLGVAGGLYSYYRYEQDRKSESKLARQRAAMYSRTSFTSKGQRYDRKTVTKNGKKYYTFVKHR